MAGDNTPIPMEIVGVGVELPSNQPIVLLREEGGSRYLPIWIGASEATAIATAMEGVQPPRPLTHDLMRSIIDAVGALPVKVVIIDNKYLGMVRQWQELFFDNRLSGVDLEGNPDFVKLAEAYHIKGIHIDKVEHVRERLQEAMDFKGPVVIWAEVIKEDNVFPMIPAGKSAYEMIIEAPRKDQKLEKPTGST